MPLRRLTTLESGKLQEEARSLEASITGFIQLLADPQALMQVHCCLKWCCKSRAQLRLCELLQVVAAEASEVATKHGVPRRTKVGAACSCNLHHSAAGAERQLPRRSAAALRPRSRQRRSCPTTTPSSCSVRAATSSACRPTPSPLKCAAVHRRCWSVSELSRLIRAASLALAWLAGALLARERCRAAQSCLCWQATHGCLTLLAVQHRGGVGVSGARLRDDDNLEEVLAVRDHDHLLFFTPAGKVHPLRAHQVPVASRTAAGTPAAQVRVSSSGSCYESTANQQAPCR